MNKYTDNFALGRRIRELAGMPPRYLCLPSKLYKFLVENGELSANETTQDFEESALDEEKEKVHERNS